MFLFFAFTGTAVAKIPAVEGSTDISIPAQTYIALCFGFSLMVNVWVFYRVSGGLFNPAVSFDLITPNWHYSNRQWARTMIGSD